MPTDNMESVDWRPTLGAGHFFLSPPSFSTQTLSTVVVTTPQYLMAFLRRIFSDFSEMLQDVPLQPSSVILFKHLTAL